MKSAFEFKDYREFLKAYYLFRKASEHAFTYAKFASEAGLSSPNYLKLIVDGKRDLTVENIHVFARTIGLSFKEHEFFEALVLWNQSTAQYERDYYRHRVDHLRPSRFIQTSKIKVNEIITHWYYPAVLVCADKRNKREAPREIASMTGLDVTHVEKVLSLLVKEGILSLKQDVYHLRDEYIVYSDPKQKNLLQKKFLLDQLELSKKVLSERYNKHSKFFSHTFTMAADEFDLYSDKIRSFIQELSADIDASPPEKVAQLNIQYFQMVSDESPSGPLAD